jgi:hypothetical protein
MSTILDEVLMQYSASFGDKANLEVLGTGSFGKFWGREVLGEVLGTGRCEKIQVTDLLRSCF